MKTVYSFFIGTYTDETDSKGIYYLKFDAGSRTAVLKEAAFLRNPSCLDVMDGVLYAGSEYEDGAAVAAYRIDGDSLHRIVGRVLDGKLLCHVFSNKAAGSVFASCFLSGSFFIAEASGLNVVSSLRMTDRMGRASWAHCGICSGDGKILAVTDMGGDRIFMCSLIDGAIDTSAPPVICECEAGVGPRHAAFNPKGDMLYTANELGNTVGVFSIDNKNIELKQSLPAGDLKDGVVNYPASIIVTNDGRYVLVSNRGYDTVSVFSVMPGGLLEKAGEYPCCGIWPRHMILTDDMRYLVLSNQKSYNIVICPFDISDGSVKPPVCEVPVPAPSCTVEVQNKEWRENYERNRKTY